MRADPGAVEALLASGGPVEALVPADLGGLEVVVRTLRSLAAVLEAAGHALSRVEVTQWRGAASTAFAERLVVEPARWRSAAEAFRSGAEAVERFGDDVAAARVLAVAAVEVYRRYVASVDALAPGAPPVPGPMGVGMRVSRLQDAVPTAAPSVVVADGLRRQALEIMDRALTQVDGAGELAARALEAACADAPQARRFWESTIRPADAVGAGHGVLDAIGLVPVAGDVADAANALWYLGEGDGTNAGLSAAGLVPVLGEMVILEKFTRRIAVRGGVLMGGPAAADILGRDTLFRLADGGLLAHESADAGHTIARHVGRTDEQLAQRLVDEPHLTRASTFTTIDDAERYTFANLGAHRGEIAEFLASGAQRTEVTLAFNHPIGHSRMRGAAGTVAAFTVVTRLTKDATMPNGYRIVTSFPDVQ